MIADGVRSAPARAAAPDDEAGSKQNEHHQRAAGQRQFHG
jgi:hypothetical protein